MSPDEVMSATKLYHRASPADGGGSGIGLYIVEQTLKMLGSKLRISSELGVGTRTSFELACEIFQGLKDSSQLSSRKVHHSHRPDENVASAKEARSDERFTTEYPSSLNQGIVFVVPKPLRILVVDDNQMIRRLTELALKRLHHHVATANDGDQAVAMLQTQSYDCCFMDINMPNMRGDVATARYRAWESEQSLFGHCLIVAMTGNASLEGEAQAREAGCDDFISKPFNQATIAQVLVKHFGVPEFP
jgi:CheY-like chemotaxis protein